MSRQDEEFQWLKSQGARGNTLQDLWYTFLTDKGYSGPLRQMKSEYKDHINGKGFDFMPKKWELRGQWSLDGDDIIVAGGGSAIYPDVTFGVDLMYTISFELEGTFNDFMALKLGKAPGRAFKNIGLNRFKISASGGSGLVFSLTSENAFIGKLRNLTLIGDK